MEYGRLEPIPGLPSDEVTAVTMESIKSVLQAHGAEDLLLTRRQASPAPQPQTNARPAPLRQMAEASLQQPPHMRSTVQHAAPPQRTAPADAHFHEEKTIPPMDVAHGGLIKRIFARN